MKKTPLSFLIVLIFSITFQQKPIKKIKCPEVYKDAKTPEEVNKIFEKIMLDSNIKIEKK